MCTYKGILKLCVRMCTYVYTLSVTIRLQLYMPSEYEVGFNSLGFTGLGLAGPWGLG